MPRLIVAAILASAGCSGSSDSCPGGATAPCPPTTTTGSLAITVSGLATGTAANITVTGQNVSRTVTATETLTLDPGTYAIAAADVIGAAKHYEAPGGIQSVAVAKGQSTNATVTYQPTAPRVHLVALGLPTGITPPWSLGGIGAGDFGVAMPGDTTVRNLPPGGYNVRAGGILDGAEILAPKPGNTGFLSAPGGVLEIATVWERAGLRDLTPSRNGVGGTPAAGVASVGGRGAIFFRITVPPGATRLRITTSGGTGDVDLFCRAGAPPAFPDKVAASGESAQNNEQCRIDNPQAGVWYAQVQDGSEPFGGVTVAADVTIP